MPPRRLIRKSQVTFYFFWGKYLARGSAHDLHPDGVQRRHAGQREKLSMYDDHHGYDHENHEKDPSCWFIAFFNTIRLYIHIYVYDISIFIYIYMYDIQTYIRTHTHI